MVDSLKTAAGENVMLQVPSGPELPQAGFVLDRSGYIEPAAAGKEVQLEVKSTSERLQLLAPFAAWDRQDFQEHLLLVKSRG